MNSIQALRDKTPKELLRDELLTDVAGQRCNLAANTHRTHRGNKLNFEEYSFQREMYKDTSRNIVVVGCVQCGKTEWATITVMAALTLDHGFNALYIMPDRTLVSKYVNGKFNQTKKKTPYYKEIVRDLDNSNMKEIGGGVVYFGISSREADFKESTCDLVIVDEWEMCNQANVALAPDRMEESDLGCMIKISNPRYRGGPIELEYENSDQKKWTVDCGHCRNACTVGWFESIVKPAGEWFRLRSDPPAVVCDKCNHPIDPIKGYWKAHNPGHPTSGYRLNHVMKSNLDLHKMWKEFNDARDDMIKLQIFYNSKAGMAYTAPGAGITLEMLSAIHERKRPGNVGLGDTSAGIDLHGHDQSVTILSEAGGRPHVLAYEKCRSTEETGRFLERHHVTRVVSDSEPGGYFVREWAEKQRAGGVRVLLSRNEEKLYGFQPKIDKDSGELRIHRTMLFDDVWNHIKSGLITIAPDLPECFTEEMTFSTRYLDIDSTPQVYRWTKGNNHAMVSLGFALLASTMLGATSSIPFRSSRTEIPRPGGF